MSTEKKIRRFEVWADCSHSSNRKKDPEDILVFENGETDEEIEAACADHLDTLIGNNFDTGWSEIEGDDE